MRQVNDMARPRRFRACLMAIAVVPVLVLGLSACGGNSAPPPQVINDKGTPFGDLLVPKLTASVKDGAVAALSISGPSSRITEDRFEELGTQVRDAAARISRGLRGER